jgi:hypothetical protein
LLLKFTIKVGILKQRKSKSIENVEDPLQLHPKTTLRLWGKVGKGETPFPKSVTPSRLCEESPIQLRGLDITPSKLPQGNINGGDFSLRSK